MMHQCCPTFLTLPRTLSICKAPLWRKARWFATSFFLKSNVQTLRTVCKDLCSLMLRSFQVDLCCLLLVPSMFVGECGIFPFFSEVLLVHVPPWRVVLVSRHEPGCVLVPQQQQRERRSGRGQLRGESERGAIRGGGGKRKRRARPKRGTGTSNGNNARTHNVSEQTVFIYVRKQGATVYPFVHIGVDIVVTYLQPAHLFKRSSQQQRVLVTSSQSIQNPCEACTEVKKQLIGS